MWFLKIPEKSQSFVYSIYIMTNSDYRFCPECYLKMGKLEYKECWLKSNLNDIEKVTREFESKNMIVARNEFVVQSALFWLRSDKGEAISIREAAADRLINMREVIHALERSIENLRLSLREAQEEITDFKCCH